MKISIITATYNSGKTILDTIKSVQTQTYKDIEHIIIDGNSQDNSLEKINKYKDSRIRIYSESDNGIYDALNKGISRAQGDVIGFLHADDLFNDQNVLMDVVAEFQNDQVDGVYGDLVYVRRSNINRIVRYWQSCSYRKDLFKKGWMPPHTTLFLRRKIYDDAGNFDVSYKISADYDFMSRIFLKRYICTKYIPRILVKMRVGGVSNKSILSMIEKSLEDFSIIRRNSIGGVGTLLLKNISKISQFLGIN